MRLEGSALKSSIEIPLRHCSLLQFPSPAPEPARNLVSGFRSFRLMLKLGRRPPHSSQQTMGSALAATLASRFKNSEDAINSLAFFGLWFLLIWSGQLVKTEMAIGNLCRAGQSVAAAKR